ncbi:transposase [Bacillus sp. CGMCC 1.16607]|uniref:transposase n=1 Tax=Bacillus sp. CGMCC 1.16607 TaxID=3351842 RepID=UPI003638B3BB
MSRKHRIWFPGATYHITARGNRKALIFFDDHDHQKFLTIVKETKEIYPFDLHSYCLMKNHIHFLLETANIPITDIMKTINTTYAIYLNKRHELNGHVFQGRFHSELITDAKYFLNTSRYIHLNPLEAEMVTNLQDYHWSSLPSFFSSAKNSLVSKEKILSFFPEPQIENYLKFLHAPNKKAEYILASLKREETLCWS